MLLALAAAWSGCRPASAPLARETKTESFVETLEISGAPLHPPPGSGTNFPAIPELEDIPDPVSEILSADLSPGETSSHLLARLSSISPEDRSFVVQLAGNYCPDEEYWRLLPFLLDRSLPEDCREEMLRDVLRRPDAVRLRPLYRLAMDPTHPLCLEAREYLFAYLQDVPENNLAALARAVEKAEKVKP